MKKLNDTPADWESDLPPSLPSDSEFDAYADWESDLPPSLPSDSELDAYIDPEENLTDVIRFLSNEPDKQGKKKDDYFHIIGCYLHELHDKVDEDKTEIYELLKDMPKPAPETALVTQFYETKLKQLTDQQLLNLCYLAIKHNPKNEEFFESALVLLKYMASDELRKTAEYQYFMSWQKVRQEAQATATASQSDQVQKAAQVPNSWQALDTAMQEFHTAAHNSDVEPEMHNRMFTEASCFINETIANAKSDKSKEPRQQSDSFVEIVKSLVIKREPSAQEVSAAKYKGLLGAAMMLAGAAAMVVGGIGVVASFVAAVPTFGLSTLGVPLNLGLFTSGLAFFGKGLDLCHEAKKEKEEQRVLKVDPALRKASAKLQTAAKAVAPMSPGKILGQGEGQNSIISSDDVKHGVNVPAFGEREKGKEEERDDQSFKRDSNEAKPYVSSNESDPQSAEKIVPLFPLHAAIKARELERIKSLLADQAVDINARDLKDRTALAYAVRDGLSEIVKYLCEAGAKAQLLPNNGYDAVLSAAEDGEADIVIALINAGANVNAADNNGQTLLHHAAKHGQGELIRMLVKAGANVNTKDKFSHDPLYYAARNSSLSSSFQAAATLLLKESRKAIEKAVNDHADAGNAAARKLFSQQVPRLNEKEGLISRNLNCIFAPPPVAPNSKQVEIAVGDNPRVK